MKRDNFFRSKMRKIISISTIQTKEYVYDLSTDCGTFCTANGVILKNTDSVYVRWKGVDMKRAFELSEEAAQAVTKSFTKPIQLEFEKVMCPLFLFTKKRYTYQSWENPNAPNPVIQQIGTQMIRRDTCKYARNALTKITEIIIKDQDKEAALLYTRKIISALLNGDIDMSELVLTRNIKDKYTNSNIPHVKLAERMQKRNDLHKVGAGERIQMIHVDDKSLVVEHPVFVQENHLRVDYMHYFNKQLKTPIDMIWGLIMEPEKVYDDILCASEKKLNKARNIEGFLKLFHQ